jgi:hypothetical protein
MTTATQVLSQSLGIIGVKAPGQALGNEAAELLERLNMMLDGWRLDRLFAPALVRVTGTMNPSDPTATIGPAADFDMDPRPIRIEEGSFYTVNGIDYPLTPISAEQYNGICLKDTASVGPCWVYFEAGDPAGTLYFYPLFSQQTTVTLLVMASPVSFADLTTDYTLEPGAKRALVYSFAEEIAGDFEKQVSPGTHRIAGAARRSLKRSHHVTPQLDEPEGRNPLANFAITPPTFISSYADDYANWYA